MANFGVGIYLLTIVWVFTLMLCWVSIRTGHYIGKLAVLVSIVLTGLLFILPKGENISPYGANFYDKLFVTRYAILTFLILSAVLSGAYCFLYACLTPIETKKIKNFATINWDNHLVSENNTEHYIPVYIIDFIKSKYSTIVNWVW